MWTWGKKKKSDNTYSFYVSNAGSQHLNIVSTNRTHYKKKEKYAQLFSPKFNIRSWAFLLKNMERNWNPQFVLMWNKIGCEASTFSANHEIRSCVSDTFSEENEVALQRRFFPTEKPTENPSVQFPPSHALIHTRRGDRTAFWQPDSFVKSASLSVGL